jgi:hypothetical protein
VIAGVGATPSATISGTASIAAGVIAGTATTPSATISGTGNVAPAVVATTSTVPSPVLSVNQEISASVIEATTSIEELLFNLRYVPVTENILSPLDIPPYPIINPRRNLRRFYTPTAKGRNIFILNDGSVTTRQPADMSTVSRTIYGGHESPTDLTDSELSALATAGYSTEVIGSA